MVVLGPTVSRARYAPGALVVGALLFLVWLVVAPWLRPDLNWEDLADAPNHLIRIYVITAELQSGNWYPRWLPDLYLGYGYPLLNFYAPATYFAAAALRSLGATIYSSFQWTGAAAVAAGAAGAYALASALAPAAPRRAGLLAAAVFLLSPYPFITNLYVRAAVPEALALGALPWMLLAGRATLGGARWAPVVLALIVAALALTHNVSTLIYLPILCVWLVFIWRAERLSLPRSFLFNVNPIALGLALAAFFWVPALLESRAVQIELASDRGGIYDPVSWLFDPLRAGPAAPRLAFDYTALGAFKPERISAWQLILWGVVVVIGVARWRRLSGQIALFTAAVVAACWFMATVWSVPLWRGVPAVALVQFPWRLYGPLALFLGLGAGCALADLPRGGLSLSGWAVGAALVGALGSGALARRPIPIGTEAPHDVDARDLVAKEYNRYGAGTTSGGEFLPRTVGWAVEGSARRGIRIYEDGYPQAGWQAGLVRILDGRAAVTAVHGDSRGIAADFEAQTPVRLAFHQLAFPGWRAYVDGVRAPISTAYYEPLQASLGFMIVEAPAGIHRVEVRFAPTRIRHAGNAISAAALVVLAGVVAGAAGRRIGPAALIVAGTVAALGVVGWGELSARPNATLRPEASRVTLDVLSAIQRGEAAVRTPTGTASTLLPPYLEQQFKWIRGEDRRWLYMHPPSEASLRLQVPAGAYLQAGLALDPAAWTTPTGDGVRFIVEADTASGLISLLDRSVNPRARIEDQAWIDVWVPLSDLAQQTVTLRLRTESGPDPTFDWAGWSNPQVVIYRAARPNPGAEHKW